MLAQTYQAMADGDVPGIVDDRAFRHAATQIIEDLAEAGDVVILGRGSQMILRDLRGATHVQLVADESIRVGRVMEWEGLSEEDAVARIGESIPDADRLLLAYVRKLPPLGHPMVVTPAVGSSAAVSAP